MSDTVSLYPCQSNVVLWCTCFVAKLNSTVHMVIQLSYAGPLAHYLPLFLYSLTMDYFADGYSSYYL